MQVPGGFDITVGKPSRITLVADPRDSMLRTVELLYQQSPLPNGIIQPVREPVSIPPPGLHLLLAVHRSMLVEVLLIQQGLFEFLPQLVDLTLLLHIVDEILAYLLPQHPLVLILSFVELLLLHLPQVVVVVAVDALVARQALDLVLDHRDLLLQDGQGDVGAALLELVGQVAELEAHLGIAATHFNLDSLASQMLYWVWESLHLQGLFVPKETLEPGR